MDEAGKSQLSEKELLCINPASSLPQVINLAFKSKTLWFPWIRAKIPLLGRGDVGRENSLSQTEPTCEEGQWNPRDESENERHGQGDRWG